MNVKEKTTEQLSEIKKYLSLAATGLSLVSFYTTAQGLHDFVFHETWQAFIISGAIQISLFIMNLKLAYFFETKGWISIALWFLTITASVTFSYVYIANEIYEDNLYYSDVHRIMDEEVMKMSLELETYMTFYRDYAEDIIEEYCSDLTVGDLQGDKASGTVNDNESKAYNYLQECEDDLKRTKLFEEGDGVFMHAVQALREASDSLPENYLSDDIEIVSISLTEIKNNLEGYSGKLEKAKEKSMERWLEVNERLKQYPNFKDVEFQSLQEQNNTTEAEIKALEEKLIEVGTAISSVEACIEKLAFEKQQNVVNKVTAARISLLLEMNQEVLNPKEMQMYMDQIYGVLIQENTSVNQQRIEDYYLFKEALEVYGKLRDLQEEKEEIIGLLDNIRVSVSGEKRAGYDFTQKDDLECWKTQWHECLNKMRFIIRQCPIMKENNTVITLEREELLNDVSAMERAYLDNVNKMEKAGNLLGSKYRSMALFALVAAIFLDGLGAMLGVFLYRKKKS